MTSTTGGSLCGAVRIPVLLLAALSMATTAMAAGGALAAVPAAPLVGGWSMIAAPASDPAVRAAARAALARLPRGHARLARIESAQSQVVAGINYRVVLRLRDGSRWAAVVWRKLDGKLAVTQVERL